MMDIDYFKRYNDTHGHPAGDVVLKRVSDLIKETTRTSDILARYGGEEFVLVLPETPKNAALKLAEKIRQLIENEKFPNAETQPNGRVTISLGVATFPDDAQDIEALVQKADEQLYRAKSEGRNRVASID
jgi:diguanylate cyclase (GGDEF)-like protein